MPSGEVRRHSILLNFDARPIARRLDPKCMHDDQGCRVAGDEGWVGRCVLAGLADEKERSCATDVQIYGVQ